MNQTSVISFFLLAGFIIFVVAHNQLPKYRAIVGI